MIRRALVVGVGQAKGETVLPGTYKDQQSLSLYLRSITGGAWNDREVTVLSDPTRQQVVEKMRWVQEADFSFVSFSGHGYERQMELYPGLMTTMTQMVCSDGREIGKNEITPKTHRSVVLLDCCRVFHTIEKRADSIGGMLERRASHTISRGTARALFERAIGSAQRGPTVLYGCEFDGTASDLPSFTQSLVATASQWGKQSFGVLHLGNAFNAAYKLHQRVSPGRRPMIDLGRGVHRPVPFAIGNLGVPALG